MLGGQDGLHLQAMLQGEVQQMAALPVHGRVVAHKPKAQALQGREAIGGENVQSGQSTCQGMSPGIV